MNNIQISFNYNNIDYYFIVYSNSKISINVKNKNNDIYKNINYFLMTSDNYYNPDLTKLIITNYNNIQQDFKNQNIDICNIITNIDNFYPLKLNYLDKNIKNKYYFCSKSSIKNKINGEYYNYFINIDNLSASSVPLIFTEKIKNLQQNNNSILRIPNIVISNNENSYYFIIEDYPKHNIIKLDNNEISLLIPFYKNKEIQQNHNKSISIYLNFIFNIETLRKIQNSEYFDINNIVLVINMKNIPIKVKYCIKNIINNKIEEKQFYDFNCINDFVQNIDNNYSLTKENILEKFKINNSCKYIDNCSNKDLEQICGFY